MPNPEEISRDESAYKLVGPANIWFAVACALVNSGLICGALLFGVTIQEKFLSVCLLISAMCVGVPAGLLLTPMGNEDEKIFSTVGRGVTTFLSGWLLAKIDGAATAIFTYDHLDLLHSFRLISAMSVFLLSATPTYIIRRYGNWDALNKRAGA